MVRIYVKKQKNYPVSVPKIKEALRNLFKREGLVSEADVSVALVSEAKMEQLARKYLKEEGVVHDVLSFPFVDYGEGFKYPPDDAIHLGDILICYPKLVEEATKEGKLIDEKAVELAEHGALHLLGKHHG